MRTAGVGSSSARTGAAHRIAYFDRTFQELKQRDGVLFMRAAEILDWYKAETEL